MQKRRLKQLVSSKLPSLISAIAFKAKAGTAKHLANATRRRSNELQLKDVIQRVKEAAKRESLPDPIGATRGSVTSLAPSPSAITFVLPHEDADGNRLSMASAASRHSAAADRARGLYARVPQEENGNGEEGGGGGGGLFFHGQHPSQQAPGAGGGYNYNNYYEPICNEKHWRLQQPAEAGCALVGTPGHLVQGAFVILEFRVNQSSSSGSLSSAAGEPASNVLAIC